MKNTLFLLTGATGLLGGNILKALTEKGAAVRVLVRDARKKIAPGAEVVLGDLLDKKSLDLFFDVPADKEIIVIHAAGLVTMDPRPDEKVYKVNVLATAGIVEKCIEKGVKKLVYVSSTGAIPELPKGQQICEVYEHDADRVVGYYSKTKALATQLVLDAVKKHDLDASVVYPSGIFGPYDYGFGLVTSSVLMLAGGKLPVAIDGSFNAVDVRDLAAGIIACAQRGKKGETYIMAGTCYTFRQLSDAICAETDVKKPALTIPLNVLRCFTWAGILYGKITRQPPWLSGYTIYNLERNNDFSSRKAQTEMGFHSRGLDETIRDTIKWLRDEGKLK